MEHGITAAPARFWRTWASGLSRSLRVCCARGSARLYSPARCPGSRGQGKLEKRREADRGSSMPGATATPDVEVIVEDARGGGGGGGRPPDGGDGGDDGDYGKEIGRASCRERGENLGEAGSVKEEGEDGE